MLNCCLMVLFLLSIIFMNLQHPISMGVTLLVYTLFVGLVTGLTSSVFWLSYVLFLVFLGGVLVLFIYMTSLASNEKFNLSWGTMVMGGLTLFVLFFAFVISFVVPASSIPMGLEFDMTMNLVNMNMNQYIFKFYGEYTSFVTYFLVFYLLYALLVCVSIVGVKHGSLRNFN